MSRDGDELRLFQTAAHPCGYFAERTARDLVLEPGDPRLATAYRAALAWGFRRSGDIVYRPHCPACRACVAVRIPVLEFTPNRSQRRCLARNADIDVRVVPALRQDEHIALYQRYLRSRHPAGGMDDHGAVEFDQFLIGQWSTTRFLELRRHGDHALLGVAVTDVVEDGLSAVYTFFDPDETERSLGTFGILQQLALAKRDLRRHLYLGYWIDGHRKMDYKRNFQPLEGYDGHDWRPMPRRE